MLKRSLDYVSGFVGGLTDEEILVNVGDDSSSSDGSLDEHVELLVTSDGQLQVSGSDSPDLEVLGSVSGQLEHLGGQVFQNSGTVDGGG